MTLECKVTLHVQGNLATPDQNLSLMIGVQGSLARVSLYARQPCNSRPTVAGLSWVIEFKYYSNLEFRKKFKTSIEQFTLPDEDTAQIAGYVDGLKAEYPEAQISHLIYCFGNQGFRVFAVTD